MPDNKKVVFGNEQIKTIVKCLKIEINEAITKKIDLFQASMIRRFKRDIKNLKEYYSSLKTEMEKNLERPGLSKQLIEERKEKIALLPDELKRKGDDLFNKYRIKVKVMPCTIMLINTPAIKILCRISVGKKTKNLPMLYNPVTKSIDPLICDGCGHSITNLHFCDNLHTLCSFCSSKCPVCHPS